MLPILRESPLDAFRPGSLETGIPVHRWEKYVVPVGMAIENMERDTDGRLFGEVPGDGNVFDHQLAQERLISQYAPLDVGSEILVETGFAKVRPISKTDFFRLRIAALVHDLGEIEHGDTVYDDKHLVAHTVKDEITATRKFVRKALDERMSRKDGANGPEDLRRKRRLERNIMGAYAIDYDKAHRLHGAFKLYEKYSYVNGAISAYGEGLGVVANAHALVHNVFKNQIDVLVRAAESGIPSAEAFLTDRLETVTAMFAWVCESGYRDENAAHQSAFEDAKRVWRGYLKHVRIKPKPEYSVRDFQETAKIAANLRRTSR